MVYFCFWHIKLNSNGKGLAMTQDDRLMLSNILLRLVDIDKKLASIKFEQDLPKSHFGRLIDEQCAVVLFPGDYLYMLKEN